MMQRRSPPKHRHDGTSPLPLGMDWSPPPRKWVSFLTNLPFHFKLVWNSNRHLDSVVEEFLVHEILEF